MTTQTPTPEKRGTFRRLSHYLHRYRWDFSAALLLMVFFGATDGGVPFLVKYVLDGVFSEHNKQLLYVLPAVLIAFACFRAACDFGQQYLMSKVGHSLVRDFRNEVNMHVLKLSPQYFVRQSSGDLLARITSDVLLVRTLMTESVAAMIRDSMRIVALLIAAIYIDPHLALIAFVALPLGIYPVYTFGRRMRKLSRTGQEAIGKLSNMLQESVLGNRVVKIFRREAFEDERFRAENESLHRTVMKSEKVRALIGPVNEVLASFAISGVILYGGLSVMNGTRSQGDFIAFLISVFLLYDPYKKVSRVHNTAQQGLSGADRIFEILDEVPTVKDPERPIALGRKNEIEFIDVSFSYRGDDQEVLSNISLHIEEGKRYALVGFSGSGKSTLVDLVPRFIDPSRGEVRIGGVNVKQASLSALRERIGMVAQHTFLFNDSIYNNILYGNPNARAEDVVAAARSAYAYDFIEQLPHGFQTVIGEGGYSLSGGERQRLAIARALLKNAPILILDEATASLDTRSEREVQAALEGLERGRTSIIIAHRLSTVREADCIVVLSEGRIVEQGSHQDLLKQQGEYAKLYALQFKSLEEESTLGGSLIN